MTAATKDLREKAAMRLHKAAAVYDIAPSILLDWYSDDLEEIANMPFDLLRHLIIQYLDTKGISYAKSRESRRQPEGYPPGI